MAVPKKRTSKAKSGKARWKHKVALNESRFISLAKSILSGKANSFIYNTKGDT